MLSRALPCAEAKTIQTSELRRLARAWPSDGVGWNLGVEVFVRTEKCLQMLCREASDAMLAG